MSVRIIIVAALLLCLSAAAQAAKTPINSADTTTVAAADKQRGADAENPAVTVAVFAFENNSIDAKEKLEPLRKAIADMMVTRLSKVKSVKVVERQRIQALIEELHLNETDMVNQAAALRVGRLLGARILVFGGYAGITSSEFRIDVRLIETETGETVTAEEETGSVDELLPMVKTLVQKITTALEGTNR